MEEAEKPIHVQRLTKRHIDAFFYIAIVLASVWLVSLAAVFLSPASLPSNVVSSKFFFIYGPVAFLGLIFGIWQLLRFKVSKIEFYDNYIKYTQEDGTVLKTGYYNVKMDQNAGKTILLTIYDYDNSIQETGKPRYFMVPIKNARLLRQNTCLLDWLTQRVQK